LALRDNADEVCRIKALFVVEGEGLPRLTIAERGECLLWRANGACLQSGNVMSRRRRESRVLNDREIMRSLAIRRVDADGPQRRQDCSRGNPARHDDRANELTASDRP
jgi:hypothetical protein